MLQFEFFVIDPVQLSVFIVNGNSTELVQELALSRVLGFKIFIELESLSPPPCATSPKSKVALSPAILVAIDVSATVLEELALVAPVALNVAEELPVAVGA